MQGILSGIMSIVFQLLIGKLRTEFVDDEILEASVFQLLIGKLRTLN